MRRAFFFIVVLCLATSSFASIPRASMPDRVSEHASAFAQPLPETRVWASEVLAPYERQPELTRALRQAYLEASTTNASGLGRFLSVDPGKDWDMSRPQSWNLYSYVRNNPVNATDPDGRKAIVRRDGNRIYIDVPTTFHGAARTPERIADFTTAVESQWSGRFGKYEVTTRVTKGGFFDNHVNLLKTVGGASSVSNWRNADIKTYLDPNIQTAVDAHEAGHLMRHDDKYREKPDKTTEPLPGWQGNIMAGVPGVTEEKNIDEVLKENRVREIKGAKQEAVPPEVRR
jgi:hypothetical protein